MTVGRRAVAPPISADAVSDGPHETELKYAVSDAAALEQTLDATLASVVRLGAARTVVVRDRYLDTADGRIAAAGFGARLRHVGDAHLVTVKSDGPMRPSAVAGHGESTPALHRRLELEAPASADLRPSTWPPSPACELVERLAGGEPLRVRLELHQTRREREVGAPDGAAVVTLDAVGVIEGGREVGSFDVLEVESRGDAAALLARLAVALEATGLVVPEPRTKDAIALEILGPDPRSAALTNP